MEDRAGTCECVRRGEKERSCEAMRHLFVKACVSPEKMRCEGCVRLYMCECEYSEKEAGAQEVTGG